MKYGHLSWPALVWRQTREMSQGVANSTVSKLRAVCMRNRPHREVTDHKINCDIGWHACLQVPVSKFESIVKCCVFPILRLSPLFPPWLWQLSLRKVVFPLPRGLTSHCQIPTRKQSTLTALQEASVDLWELGIQLEPLKRGDHSSGGSPRCAMPNRSR